MSTTLRKLRQLERLVSAPSNAIVHVYVPGDKDYYMLAGDFLAGLGYATWNSVSAAAGDYDTGSRVTYGFRLWESLVDNNMVIPTEGASWTEVSPTSLPTIASVLTEDNDADGQLIKNLGNPVDDQDADTKAARDAAITAAINALVDSSPGALDTLNELAAALGDDANFATTVTNALALKEALANKATDFSAINDTKYPSVKAVDDRITAQKSVFAVSGQPSRKMYNLMWLDTAGASGNQDWDLFSGLSDAVIKVIIDVVAIKSDGSEAASYGVSATFRRDGSATPVQVDDSKAVTPDVDDDTDGPTVTLGLNSGNVRLSYDTGSADVYRWTAFATIIQTVYASV